MVEPVVLYWLHTTTKAIVMHYLHIDPKNARLLAASLNELAERAERETNPDAYSYSAPVIVANADGAETTVKFRVGRIG